MPSEKPQIQAKYKQLRNWVTNQIRKETIHRNGERIAEAKNERETWRVVNEIIKPKSESTIVINTTEGETSDEHKVAEAFNTFFVEKIRILKETVDPNLVKDPLERLKENVKNKNLLFKIKSVSSTTV